MYALPSVVVGTDILELEGCGVTADDSDMKGVDETEIMKHISLNILY